MRLVFFGKDMGYKLLVLGIRGKKEVLKEIKVLWRIE